MTVSKGKDMPGFIKDTKLENVFIGKSLHPL